MSYTWLGHQVHTNHNGYYSLKKDHTKQLATLYKGMGKPVEPPAIGIKVLEIMPDC